MSDCVKFYLLGKSLLTERSTEHRKSRAENEESDAVSDDLRHGRVTDLGREAPQKRNTVEANQR